MGACMVGAFLCEGESGDNVPAVNLCDIGGIFACRAMESVGADFTFCKLATAKMGGNIWVDALGSKNALKLALFLSVMN